VSGAVITGVGVVSAFGVGARCFFDGLAEGRDAVRPIRSFDASAFPVGVAGEVPVAAIDASWMAEHLDREADRQLETWAGDGILRDRKTCFALLAASEAWRSAGALEPERGAWLSIALGLEQGFLEDLARVWDGRAFDWRLGADLPRLRYRAPVDLAAECVGQALGLTGPTVVHASACAAGALAVAHAASLIERGTAEVVLCGAADSMVNPMAMGAFWRLGAPSLRREPDACRPFDRRRDGLAIGEGAAMFVVESELRARGRGRRPFARVLGWGSTQDAYRATAPRPDGAAARAAIERCLVKAGVGADRVGYINAHGTGTPLNDPAEAKAIRAALGACAGSVPVSSIKGAVGHLMAASGAIEIAASLLPFERGLLPGTAHHRELDPECDLDVIGPSPRPARVDTVLSNSFGFGGQNASVLLGRWEGDEA